MNTEESEKKNKRAKSLPESQFNLVALAETVSNKWLDNPQITLLWMKSSEFKTLVSEFRIFLDKRIEAGSGRSSQAQTLQSLDKEVNQVVEEVKIAILAKFGREKGKAYFSEFGIIKQNNKISIPNDRNQRISALPLLVKAIKNHNLQIVGYTTGFFETLVNDYTIAFQAAQTTDSAISVSVSNKNDLRKQVEAVLSALKTLIKINYPNTYEGELRGWGFQKEKY